MTTINYNVLIIVQCTKINSKFNNVQITTLYRSIDNYIPTMLSPFFTLSAALSTVAV